MDKNELGMFKQYDVRTKWQNLSAEMKDKLCRAIAVYYRDNVKAESVVICRDARLYVPELADTLTNYMNKAGIDVFINPLPISTCQFYFSCMKHRDSAGIMITASHNPGEYVGMKFLAPNVLPIAYGYGPDGGIEKIKELYIANVSIDSDKKGKCTVINHMNSYIDYCMNLSGVTPGYLSGVKILLEFLNGSAGTEVVLAFQKAGADVVIRNIIPNGFFPNGDPNPIIESSISPARLAMKDSGCNIGFCFDGDGDRMDLMWSDGQQIVPGLNMSIIIKKIMDIYGGTKKKFYADVKAIPISLCEIAKAGVEVHIIRNGHSFIKGKLHDYSEQGFFCSEEESAHYYINFPFDPKCLSKGFAPVEATLFFALLTSRCYKENPAEYERVYALQNSIFREREWPLHCESAPEKMQQIMDEVEKKMKSLGGTIIKKMDDGSDLDAVLMRFNLPERFDANSTLTEKKWVQVAQRISRSEDAMCRWEVVSNDKDECERLNNEVKKITDRYVANGWAKY